MASSTATHFGARPHLPDGSPALPSPATYVPLPRRLLEDLRDAPAAIAAYALIARLHRVLRGPVPLSPADLQAFDPALSYGAATRALQRLVACGYALATREPGRKTAYAPTWGLVRGAPLAWDLNAPCLGRPRHIPAVRLDDRLLDVCLGRLRPHPSHPAVVERYCTAALLSLREVGWYALALGSVPFPTSRLAHLGLLDEAGRPLPLPDTETVLAVASQRALTGAAESGLTPAGWAQTSFKGAPAGAAGQPLFFVPPSAIGGLIAGEIVTQIAPSTSVEAGSTAPASGRGRAVPPPKRSHGVTEKDGENGPPPNPPRAGGGLDSHSQHHPATESPSSSEGSKLLRAIGARADSAAELSNRPLSQIQRVIAQVQARSGVRDRAGWVVAALRALPAEELAVVPAPRVSDLAILTHPELTNDQRQRWLIRFRNADLADRPALLARFHEEHPR